MLNSKVILSKNANIQLMYKIELLFDFNYNHIDEGGEELSNMDEIAGGSGGTVI